MQRKPQTSRIGVGQYGDPQQTNREEELNGFGLGSMAARLSCSTQACPSVCANVAQTAIGVLK
jgi:hypothetical protein